MVNYNVHPLLVHFPLALLSVYAVLEILRLPVLTRQQWYRPTKVFLVVLGVLSTYPTALAGDYIKNQLRGHGLERLISLHENFATATIIVFSVIAGAYLIAAIDQTTWARAQSFFRSAFWRFFSSLSRLIIDTPLVWVLALAGLIVLTITGALGGTIVYGPNNDPFIKFIFTHLVRHL